MTDNPHNLPWHCGPLVKTDIYDAAGSLPGVSVRTPELANFVVRAVNTHAALVAALEIADQHLEAGAARDEVRAALAAAKGITR